MTQRLHNLSKWVLLEEGAGLVYPNKKRRTVILDVNSPDRVSLYVTRDDDSSAQFIALVEGLDSVEFGIDGAFTLLVEGGSCFVYTADSTDISFREIAPVIFTRLAQRRSRNPELELMMYTQRLNQAKRDASMTAEFNRRMDQMEAKYAKQRNQGVPLGPDGKRQAPGRVPNSVEPETRKPGTAPAEAPGDEGGGDTVGKPRKVKSDAERA